MTAFEQAEPAYNGTMFLIPAGTKAEAIAPDVEEISTTVTLQLKPDWLVRAVEADQDWISRDPNPWIKYYSSEVEMVLRRIAIEMAHPNGCSQMVIEACSRIVAADLFKSRLDSTVNSAYPADALDDSRVNYIKDMLNHHNFSSLNLEDIASSLGICRAHLTSIFKRKMGITVHAYIQEFRLNKAKSLLKETRTPLKQISHELGYGSPSAFSNAFRTFTGKTPREYRIGPY